ncbi:four-carbon acid sugar kinase family protein [Prochlorococcus sp. MIT 1307]|uniref:four-carbon acid sugar kinase family protein n=1 Tax=Prochlorococcus sp. MIT 1307 TaxID=3096219 RepID=UPI002A7562C6|nr:four-carbon acid sugar kinase family protein [Prochlorococcus sp. MIT 1307]
MKIVVFDDDPTGSQTVYGCPLLLRWDKSSLVQAINHPSPLLFLLANTRSMNPVLAEKRIGEICQSIKQVLIEQEILLENICFVSRGDSTLRGHGTLEPEVINSLLGPFDATLHVPAFLEGGRTTVNGVHFLHGKPVHTTEFARDKAFGYSTSDLDLWLQEKSRGKIVAQNVDRLNFASLDAAINSKTGLKNLIDFLLALSGNRPVVVDAQHPSQLEVLGKVVRTLIGRKRFLFRSAASLINGLSNLPGKTHNAEEFASLRLKESSGDLKPGLVMVGSHVRLADEQLELLLKQDCCEGIEFPAKQIASVFLGDLADTLLSDFETEVLYKLNLILASRKTPVIYTTRGEIYFSSIEARINFGNFLAEFMASVVKKVIIKLGYVISKGGVTTHTFLEKGLNLASVELKGQLLPGLSVVCATDYSLAEGLPIVTFPGNLGFKDTLLSAWQLMENDR